MFGFLDFGIFGFGDFWICWFFDFGFFDICGVCFVVLYCVRLWCFAFGTHL